MPVTQWRNKALRGPGSTVTSGPLSCFATARSAESGVGLFEGLQLGSGVSSPVVSPAAKTMPSLFGSLASQVAES